MGNRVGRERVESEIRRELPALNDDRVHELTGIIVRIVEALQPERIYAFGSRARADAEPDSDIDLMVIVPKSDRPRHQRAQLAYQSVGLHRFPTDILVWTRDEFEQKKANPANLPATILREGRELYAA
jgi:uncharacterized protein